MNDPPVAVADRVEVDEGDTVLLEASELLANDFDPDGDILKVTEVGGRVSGSVRIEGITMPLLGCGWATPEPSEV